jgi:enoyl-CoA hydratase/carnithine racemase
MSFTTIEFQVEGFVATVTLDQVHHNAFTQQMMDEVRQREVGRGLREACLSAPLS